MHMSVESHIWHFWSVLLGAGIFNVSRTCNVKYVTLLTCTWSITYTCSQQNWPKMSNMWLYWHVHEALHQIAEITVIRDTDCQKIAGITVIRDTDSQKIHEALHTPAPNKTDQKCQICDSTDMYMKHYIHLLPTKLTKNVKSVTLLTCTWSQFCWEQEYVMFHAHVSRVTYLTFLSVLLGAGICNVSCTCQ
jgi:hypothetical protein